MDAITGDTLRKAADLVDRLVPTDVHTVNLVLDGRTGGCLVTVSSEADSDVVLIVGA